MVVMVAAWLLASPAAAQGSNAPASPKAASLFVLVYRQGPNWKSDLPVRQQPNLGAHGAYMKRLFDQGATLAAGPTTDAPGGLVILRADSLEQAQAMMAADPAVTTGLFVGEAHAWAPVVRRDEPVPPPAIDTRAFGNKIMGAPPH
jgi:uncharacterized protein YciI